MVFFAGVAQLVWLVYERRSRDKEGRPLPHTATVLPVLYALSSSMIGSISVLQAKCISELLETLSGGENVWRSGMTYLAIGLFLSTVSPTRARARVATVSIQVRARIGPTLTLALALTLNRNPDPDLHSNPDPGTDP